MPVPKVIVTFYENLHFEIEDVSRAITKLGAFGEDAESGDFYLLSTTKVIATAGTWKIGYRFQTVQQGETGPIAFNASAASVKAALEATTWGEWDVTEVGPQEFLIKMWARAGATFGVQPGLGGKSIDLSGVEEEVPHHDEVEYEVPLEEGVFGGPKLPVSEVEPTALSGEAKKSRPRSASQHMGETVLQDNAGENPFPDYSPPITS